ncbi:MAG: cytochrome c3 family protein [Myxococcota bacterium]
MAQIFPPSANAWARASIVGLLGFIASVFALGYAINSGGYVTRQNLIRHQEVPFSHRHHVQSMGIDCRYCHWSAEESNYAGVPPTHTCMTCHSQIWVDSPMLAPVRESYDENKPLVWSKVHDLPDYVYFNHAIHVAKGIGCASCHGPVQQMALVWQDATLHMSWCLECHRNPEEFIRPRSEIYNMTWDPSPARQEELGRHLLEAYNVQSQDHCYTCHR